MKPKVIHIAGSKGKGTTAHLLAAILQDSGARVGLFTSPWILDRKEMIQVNGECISEMDLCQIVESLPSKHSEFEQLTLAAFEYFRQQRCDFWVLECGWGGSIDATNWVEHKDLALLTHVELEHCAVLGDSLEAIAREQLGIVVPGVPLITLPTQAAEVLTVLDEFEHAIAPPVELGVHHPESAGLAIAAAKYFGIEADENRLEKLVIPGRFEELQINGKTVILDGAHTMDSVRHVLKKVHGLLNTKSVHFAVHFLSDKNPELCQLFHPSETSWVKLDDPRAGENLCGFELRSIEEILARKENHIVVLGSFKLVAAIKRFKPSCA